MVQLLARRDVERRRALLVERAQALEWPPPAGRSCRYSPTTSAIGERSRTAAMSSWRIRPGMLRVYGRVGSGVRPRHPGASASALTAPNAGISRRVATARTSEGVSDYRMSGGEQPAGRRSATPAVTYRQSASGRE